MAVTRKRIDEVTRRLEAVADANFQANHAEGRRGREWDISQELTFKAAAIISELEAERANLRTQLKREKARNRAPAMANHWPV